MRGELIVCLACVISVSTQGIELPRLFSLLETLYPLQSPVEMISGLMGGVEQARLAATKLAQVGFEPVDRIGDIDTGFGNGIFRKVLASLLGLVGLEDSSMGRMAVNLLAYLAELLANYLAGSSQLDENLPRYRMLAEQGVVPFVQEVLEHAEKRGQEIQDSMLSEYLTDNMINNLQLATGNSTSCVQLFLCKSTPIVNTVQRALNNTLEDDQDRSLYASSRMLVTQAWINAPSFEEYIEQGDFCEFKFPSCQLMTF